MGKSHRFLTFLLFPSLTCFSQYRVIHSPCCTWLGSHGVFSWQALRLEPWEWLDAPGGTLVQSNRRISYRRVRPQNLTAIRARKDQRELYNMSWEWDPLMMTEGSVTSSHFPLCLPGAPFTKIPSYCKEKIQTLAERIVCQAVLASKALGALVLSW